MKQQITWLALGYHVPVNPSKNRVYVWRKLKEFGAGHFKQGVAVLPVGTQSMAKFSALAAKIRELGGEATLAELKYCDPRDEAAAVEWFEKRSEGEYRELMRDCADIVRSLRENIFPVSGRGDQIKKINKRYNNARSRDYFKSRSYIDIMRGIDELLADMAHVTDELMINNNKEEKR